MSQLYVSVNPQQNIRADNVVHCFKFWEKHSLVAYEHDRVWVETPWSERGHD
jgi:hypothetical protein